MPGASLVSGLARGLAISAAACLLAWPAAAPIAAAPGQTAISEQDLLVLLPYRLATDELPAGFELYDDAATSNAALAFGAAPESRDATLAALRASGRVTGLQQTFVPTSRGDSTVVRLLLSLYTDADSAAAAVNQVAPSSDGAGAVVDLDASALAPGARLLHLPAAGSTPDIYIAVWSIGPLQFAITVTGTAGSADLATVFALVAQQHAAAAGGIAGMTAPIPQRDDAQALAVAAALEQAQLPAGAVPAAFGDAGAYLWSNEQLVLDARQPDTIAHLIVDEWGRVSAAAKYFTTSDSGRTLLTTAIAAFVDPFGAQRGVEDESLTAATRQAVLPLVPPAQLGDETIAYRATVRWPRAELRESYTVQWRHGAVALSVTVNVPAGGAQPAYLGEVAAVLDAAYLAAGEPESGGVQ